MRIKVKPLSVNECWQGRRFKTVKYKVYEDALLYTLKPLGDIPDRIHLCLKFGLSSKNADLDNCVKPFVDILQKRYGFNDKQIYKYTLEKIDTAKGDEFIQFDFIPLQVDN